MARTSSRTSVEPASSNGTSASVAEMEVKPQATRVPTPPSPAPKPSKEKMLAVGQAVVQIEKAFGKGSIMKLDE